MSKPPQVVIEFGRKALALLERDGKIRPKVDGRIVRTLGLPPLWLLGWDSRPGGLYGLFISLPGPYEAAGNRITIYEHGNHGFHYKIEDIKLFLPMLTRRLILEELADL